MRKPEFGKESINNLHNLYTRLRDKTLEEFEKRLRVRDPLQNDLKTDDVLFEPFIDVMVYSILSPFSSIIKEIAFNIDGKTSEYETRNKVTINKEHFYYALATISISSNDEINAMINWERAHNEFLRTHQIAGPNLHVTGLEKRFTQIYKPIKDSYKSNTFIRAYISQPFIKDFDSLFNVLTSLDQLHFLSDAIRNRKIQGWLRVNNNLSMVQVYCQELVNSLTILNESLLKKNSAVNKSTLGKIFKENIPVINASVSNFLNGPSVNLFNKYPTNNIPSFNTNFPLILQEISICTNPDQFRALILYGMYMIRNQVLHQHDNSIVYFSNKAMFENTIGLLLVNLSVIISL